VLIRPGGELVHAPCRSTAAAGRAPVGGAPSRTPSPPSPSAGRPARTDGGQEPLAGLPAVPIRGEEKIADGQNSAFAAAARAHAAGAGRGSEWPPGSSRVRDGVAGRMNAKGGAEAAGGEAGVAGGERVGKGITGRRRMSEAAAAG
jgi:hypothetical protein